MAELPLPSIDPTRCTGCHVCVDICPTGALAQTAGKAYLAYPERCTYCTACEDQCPEDAIALPFLIVFAPRSDQRGGQPSRLAG